CLRAVRPTCRCLFLPFTPPHFPARVSLPRPLFPLTVLLPREPRPRPARLFGLRESVELATALVRWTGLAAIFALFAWKGRSTVGREIAQALAALLTY